MQGLSAITDFALFALTGLAVTTVLGRFMEREAYGVFAGAFASYLVLMQAHGSVLAEPMLVLSSQRFEGQHDEYLRTLLGLHGALSLLMLLACGLVALLGALLGSQAVASAGLAVGLAAPSLTLMQFLRRVCYGRMQVPRAALGGTVYLAGVTALLAFLHHTRALGVLSAFASMAVVSLVVSWAWLVGFGVARSLGGARLPLREVWDAHAAFAAWGSLAAILSWVPWNAWFVLLPAVSGTRGLHVSAELRAVFNLAQPMMQVCAALGTLLVPTFAARASRDDRKPVLRWLFVLVGGSCLYAPLMIWAGPWAMQLLYAGRYTVDATTLLRLSLVPAAFAVFTVLKAWALALGEPRRVFVASAASGAVSASVGVWLCSRGTLPDAALAMALAFGLQAIALAYPLFSRGPMGARNSP